nr:RNA-directed DNA polymerase, eukaryota [Tanacetum cinerariifolium]
MECNVAYNLIEYDDKNNGLVILDELFQKDGGSKELESSNNSTRLRSNPPLLSLKIVKASLNTPKRGVIHGGFIREILVSFEKVTRVRKELNLGFDFKLIELLLASYLWNVCDEYGKVVDVYIPNRKSKAGRLRLHANIFRFQIPSASTNNKPKVMPVGNQMGSYASMLKMGKIEPTVVDNTMPSLVLDDACIRETDRVWKTSRSQKRLCIKTKLTSIIFESFKVIMQGKMYWARAKEMYGWNPVFREDKYGYNSSDEESVGVGLEGIRVDKENVNSKMNDSDIERVSKSSFAQGDKSMHEPKEDNQQEVERNVQSQDPLNIYELLNKQKGECVISSEDNFPYPSGFTPMNEGVQLSHNMNSDGKVAEESKINDVEEHINIFSHEVLDKVERDKEDVYSQRAIEIRKQNRQEGESILHLIEELVKVGQTMGYNMDGCIENMEAIIGGVQGENGIIFKASVTRLKRGNSGGILCVWKSSMFVKENVSVSDSFLAITGTWVSTATRLLIISVYASRISRKRLLWGYLCHIKGRWDGECIILGDFNEVRIEDERFGTVFNVQGANAFNNFISLAGLVDLPLGRYSFTWSHKTATKMSKLDRFLIFEGLLTTYPNLSAICLDRHLSDHRPILLKDVHSDYDAIPFRMFNSWFQMDGFDKMVEQTWKSMDIVDPNGLIRLKKKLQVLDQGGTNTDILKQRMELVKSLNDLESLEAMDITQKAKVRWSIEGDENTKFVHGILNNKISQLSIRGILMVGDWVNEPVQVKHAFFSHFADRFNKKLERNVSDEDIKRAVWDCGASKSPGPDGYTFEFFCCYWNFIEQDVIAAVKCFFSSGSFPKGCNSSFIALILKIQDAKLVKDFRPITLVGSVYKIITKLLANRLSQVISDLISDVQSAFVANRHILDGPFILNELISWCKSKKNKAVVFKVDFEKAYDSIRWDYLNDILRKFGFGDRWRMWINGCLNSSMGSVLVNGSPSAEFQFFKGLKQGDPLSLFLFILVMESLHISFNRVMQARLFTGVPIDDSMVLSHLFFADDVVFIEEWNDSNLNTIVHVLKSFFLASGLKINIHESKLMGIGVRSDEVDRAAKVVGCSTLSTPFSYLGVTIGGRMSRIQTWDVVVRKLSSRLSRWKLKTLSVGGRLTLLKSVLGSIPLYHMSIFKVPKGVINNMEAIRRNFFNGSNGVNRKMSYISWDKVLISKKKGGLGVSSYFALNRALLFKWVWRFVSQDSSLWSRKVGNGENTRFWEDVRMGDSSLKCQFPRLYVLDTCKEIFVADKLRHESLVFSFRRVPRGGIEADQYDELSSCLDSKRLVQMNDRWVIPIKINVFAWKVQKDRLPCRLNLSRLGIDIPSILCPICDSGVESLAHFAICLSVGSSSIGEGRQRMCLKVFSM